MCSQGECATVQECRASAVKNIVMNKGSGARRGDASGSVSSCDTKASKGTRGCMGETAPTHGAWGLNSVDVGRVYSPLGERTSQVWAFFQRGHVFPRAYHKQKLGCKTTEPKLCVKEATRRCVDMPYPSGRRRCLKLKVILFQF